MTSRFPLYVAAFSSGTEFSFSFPQDPSQGQFSGSCLRMFLCNVHLCRLTSLLDISTLALSSGSVANLVLPKHLLVDIAPAYLNDPKSHSAEDSVRGGF